MESAAQALDARARRAARRIGLIAKKSRRHCAVLDDLGNFVLIDPDTNFAIAGARFDMSAEDVIAYCIAGTRSGAPSSS